MNAARLHAVPAEASRVVGYIRVSTAREEMISPELQRSAIEDYCARRGYILDDVIEDLDASGRNFTRKGVQRAIELVENSGVAVVVVWKYSRFGRDRKGWAVNLDRVESVGGRLESATEDLDTTTSTGKFTRGMLAEVAAWESDRIGEGWQETHKRRLENGLPHSGSPRLGYIYHRATVGERLCPQGCAPGACETGYLVDPEMSVVVGEMYDRYNSGQSHRAIAIWLNGRGIMTTLGKTWDARNVRRFFDTGFAAGLLRVHDKACRCKTPQTCARNTYQDGAHDAIITATTWETYNRNRTRRRHLAPRVENPVYVLAGLLKCGRCTGPLNAHGIKHHGTYKAGYVYQCTANAKGKPCPGTYITRARLERAVIDWVERVAAAEVNERAAMTAARKAARSTAQADRKRLLREAQKLAEAVTRLTVDRAKGVVREADYTAARDELEQSRERVDQALAALADDVDKLTGPPVRVARDLITRWPTLPPAVRRELLGKLVTKISVTSHGRGVADVLLLTTWGEEIPL